MGNQYHFPPQFDTPGRISKMDISSFALVFMIKYGLSIFHTKKITNFTNPKQRAPI